MLCFSRRQLLYFITAILNIALIFRCIDSYAQKNASILKGEKEDSGTVLHKRQCKGCNLIIISLNNIGTEHMSLYGYRRRTTPNLDKWARNALVFENVFSPVSWTLPVATTLFTSLYPYTHKIMDRYNKNLLDKKIKTLPEILRDNNYKTGAFTGGLDYMKLFGHMRGFVDIDDNPPFTSFSVSLKQAKKWLSKNSNNKFFLFIHGYDAHPPFIPPERFKGTFSDTKGKNITVDNRMTLRGCSNVNNEYVAAHYIKQDNPLGLQKKQTENDKGTRIFLSTQGNDPFSLFISPKKGAFSKRFIVANRINLSGNKNSGNVQTDYSMTESGKERLYNNALLNNQEYETNRYFVTPAKGEFRHLVKKYILFDIRIYLRWREKSNNGYRLSNYISQENPLVSKFYRGQKESVKSARKKEIILTQDDIDYLRDLYDETVLNVDYMIRDFLNSLDRDVLKKTIIIIFSEHGEMFAKHGRFGRAGTVRGTLYDDVVHVPLLIKMPQVKGKRIAGLVQIIDIMPTLLNILDIPLHTKIQGVDILPLINNNEPVNEYVYAGSQYNVSTPSRDAFYNIQSINESIRDYKWKLIHEINLPDPNANSSEQTEKETYELYDIKNDPNEYTNLIDKYPGKVRELMEKLNNWAKWSKEFAPFSSSSQKLPEDLLEEARKNGYW